MACEHDLGEMDTAAHWDGLCPLCQKAEIERLTEELAIANQAIGVSEWRRQECLRLQAENERLRVVLSNVS